MSARATDPPVVAMNRLAFLEGSWEGQGCHQASPQAERHHFTQTELVQRHLDGELLTVEGCAYAGEDSARIVHQAFAVVSYDTALARYRWEAFSQGRRIETDLTVTDAGFEWSVQLTPDALMRYHATITSDQWNEAGELSTDHGQTWSTTLQMHLRRIG